MYSIDIEIEQLYGFFLKQDALVKEINDAAIILDQAGAPKEERYQKVLDFSKKIVVQYDQMNSYGLIYYILLSVFGLAQHAFQVAKSSTATLFPGVKEYRNFGIREYNSYQREVTDKKIQDRLETNLELYIKGKDRKSELLLDLDYLEKYRKVNCMKVAREITNDSNSGDESAITNSDNKKAYEKALNVLRGF